MQVHINDHLYHQLSDYAARAHMKIDRLIEVEMAKLLKKQTNVLDFKPDPHWPEGMFTPYNDDSFPDIQELRADLIEPRPLEL